MKLEQAARQALEALEICNANVYVKGSEAITALRKALAEQATVSGGVCGGCAKKAADGWALYCVECWEKAEQEPVAWLWVNEQGSERLEWEPVKDISKWKSTPLYTHPVRTKDLTDDEIYKLADDVDWAAGAYLGFARAVIAADREKNK